MKNSNKKIGWAVIVIGLIVTGIALKNNSKTSLPAESMEQKVEEKTVEENLTMTDSPETVELELSNYKFSQETITVKAGQTVTIKLKNTEGFHDFVIDELGVASKQIIEGQEDVVTFTIPEAASGQTYQYYCSVGGHRELGMVGTLQVE